MREKINHTLLPHQVHAMSDSQRSNPIQQPQRPAQVREFFKQRIAMVTKKVIKAHENPQALLLYDASLQVVANSHNLAESVYKCNGGSHPVIGRHFRDRGGGLRIIFSGKMETVLLLKMAFSQRDRKMYFCRRSFALGEGFSNIYREYKCAAERRPSYRLTRHESRKKTMETKPTLSLESLQESAESSSARSFGSYKLTTHAD